MERSTENSQMLRISYNIGEIRNDKPQGGESISSGGRASEI